MSYIFNIREMTISDVDEIEKIEQESFDSDRWNISQIKEELNNTEFKFPIVIELYTPTGYYVTFSSASIAKIAIKKEYRNKGFAVELIKEIEKDCYIKKVINLTLEVRKSNVKAINLYKKCGFKEIIKKPHYYSDGEDAIYMMKEVNNNL